MSGVGLRKLVAVVAAVVILATVPATPATASSRLEELRRQARATRSRLASALHTDAQILAELRVITGHLNREASTLASARANLARVDLAIKAEERRLADLATQRATRAKIVAARARALYIMGPFNGATAFTDGGTLDDFIGRAGSLEYVMSFDRAVLEDLARIRDQAVKTKAALRDRRVEAIEQRNDIAERVEVIDELQNTQLDAHNRLSSTIDAYRDQLAAIQREQSRIMSIINSRGSRGRISGVPGKLGFAWPTSSHNINSSYGPRWGGFHTGLDIQCHQGQKFAAAKKGKVIEAGYAGGYGRMTIIDHGGGYQTLYAHQSSISVGRGQRVSRGQVIGRCGSTGNSTGAHMHFEIRYNGSHRNPRPYLP